MVKGLSQFAVKKDSMLLLLMVSTGVNQAQAIL
jgi:hypothetical protein